MATRFAGLILAGGAGRRWGGPKAFARLPDGRSFLEACCELLTEAGARPVVATVPRHAAVDVVPGLRAVPLPTADLDMFGSLSWGLRHLLADPGWRLAAVLPVDHPLVAPRTVRRLMDAARGAVRPVFVGKRGHPVGVPREIADAVARGEFVAETLRDVLASAGAADVEVDDPAINANCNTPEALQRWLDRLRADHAGDP